MIMRKFFVFSMCVVCMVLVSCGTHKTSAYVDFETKVIGSELDGSYTLRVSGRGRNAADAYVQAGKQAVYDVMFTLIPVQSGVAEKNLKPLLLEVNAKEKYEAYVNALLKDNGEYLEYMSMKEKRSLSSSYSKTNAQTVCVTTVCVYRNKLRERLVKDGIIK